MLNPQNQSQMTPTTFNDRTIPELELEYYTNEKLSRLMENDKFSVFLYNEIIGAIEKYYKNRVAKIFVLKNTTLVYSIKKSDYKSVLNRCLLFFQGREEYLKCAKIRDLITVL